MIGSGPRRAAARSCTTLCGVAAVSSPIGSGAEGTAAELVARPRLILVTGVMAAGKSTVAQLLAEELPRAAHVRGDVFRSFVVSGRVEPTPSMPPEAMRQLLLRYQLAISVADAYVRAGYTAVVQDVIVGPVLADVVAMATTRPLHLVVLDADTDAVAEREAQRRKWLDTSLQTPAETVGAILTRLPASEIDPPPPGEPVP